MKQHLYSILLAGLSFNLLCFAAPAQKNLIKNGDFEKGSSGWRGDKNIVFETPAKKNRICKIKINKEKDITFYQEIKVSNITSLKIRYKVKKSADYNGEGLQIMIKRDDGTGSGTTPKLPNNNEWNEREWKANNITKGQYRIKVCFTAKRGRSGTLSFDDIEIVESVEPVKPARPIRPVRPTENISPDIADGYRIFTDGNGREVEAKIIRTTSKGQKVIVQRKGLRNSITIPVSSFNDETQDYIKCWSQHSDFLNDRLLSVETKKEQKIVEDHSSTYNDESVVAGGTDHSSTTKNIYHGHSMNLVIKNKSEQRFSNISVEYTLYYNQEMGRKNAVRRGRLYKEQTVNISPKSEQKINTEQIVLQTYSVNGASYGTNGWKGEFEGVIIHLTLELETGDTMTREIIYPKRLKYDWTTETKNAQPHLPSKR